MRNPRLWLIAVVSVTGLVLFNQPVFAANPPTGLSGRTRSQIEALAVAKAKRTPAETKIESSLLTAAQVSGGRALPAGVRVRSGVKTDAAGRVRITVRGKVTPTVLHRVRELGVRFAAAGRRTASSVPTYRSARSSLSVTWMMSGACRRSPQPPSRRGWPARGLNRASRSAIGCCASGCGMRCSSRGLPVR